MQEVAAGNGLGAGAAMQIMRVWQRAFGAAIRALDFLTARESEVLIHCCMTSRPSRSRRSCSCLPRRSNIT
jgi:hypothetical protein